MKKISILLLTFSIHFISISQSWEDTAKLIDKIFDRYKPGNPGCQLAISRHGQIIYSRAWGMADMEHGIALTNNSIIEAGSVSKQFTAAAILLLEQQGKLSLNDDVHKYVPELPDYGTPITLRQMMQHASGLKDWGAVAAISGWPRSTKTYNNDDALYIISRQKTLNHKPGDEYLYSNSNYNLFAIIVERVSGRSLAEFTRINIFEPAGMKHTEWRNNYKKIVANRAIAYQKSINTYFTDMPNEYVYGNGGLLTTAEDLLIWNNYYLNNKLGNPSLLPKQLSTSLFNNGSKGWYGAGLDIDSVRGWKIISHDGATAGYRSTLAHFPDLGLSIAWLSNTSEFDQAPPPSDSVRNLLVKNISSSQVNTVSTPINVSIEKLNSYIGTYRDPRTANSVRLFIRDGKLANSRGGNLTAVTENVFLIGAGQTKIEVLPGKAGKLRFISPIDTVDFPKVDTANLDEKTMSDYVGEYYSEETESKFTVLIKSGKIVVHRDPKADFILIPLYKDGFSSSAGTIFFERGKKNKIVNLKIFVGRARNVVFNKIK